MYILAAINILFLLYFINTIGRLEKRIHILERHKEESGKALNEINLRYRIKSRK